MGHLQGVGHSHVVLMAEGGHTLGEESVHIVLDGSQLLGIQLVQLGLQGGHLGFQKEELIPKIGIAWCLVLTLNRQTTVGAHEEQVQDLCQSNGRILVKSHRTLILRRTGKKFKIYFKNEQVQGYP